MGEPRHPPTADDDDAPLHERRQIDEDRCSRNHSSDHSRGCRDNVERVIEPRDSVRHNLEHGRGAEREYRRGAADPLPAFGELHIVGAGRYSQRQERHENSKPAGGRESKPKRDREQMVHPARCGWLSLPSNPWKHPGFRELPLRGGDRYVRGIKS